MINLIKKDNIFTVMKKIEKNSKLHINHFDFIITPLEITFEKTEAQSYAFELNKGTSSYIIGAQVYHRFSEVIWVHAEERTFKLVNKESVEIKILSEHGLAI